MTRYYAENLSGERLRRVYDVAPPRVRRYLEAELAHACARLRGRGAVLELGCGTGRLAAPLAAAAGLVVGVDNAPASLAVARAGPAEAGPCLYAAMDAGRLACRDAAFDAVACLQNGICAFGLDADALAAEALRVTRPGGVVLLSSYADAFWPHRLAWFEAQAAAGLLGEVDREASGDGVIVCRDGFRAGRMTPDGFRALGARLGVRTDVGEVDAFSVFCEMVRP